MFRDLLSPLLTTKRRILRVASTIDRVGLLILDCHRKSDVQSNPISKTTSPPQTNKTRKSKSKRTAQHGWSTSAVVCRILVIVFRPLSTSSTPKFTSFLASSRTGQSTGLWHPFRSFHLNAPLQKSSIFTDRIAAFDPSYRTQNNLISRWIGHCLTVG